MSQLTELEAEQMSCENIRHEMSMLCDEKDRKIETLQFEAEKFKIQVNMCSNKSCGIV